MTITRLFRCTLVAIAAANFCLGKVFLGPSIFLMGTTIALVLFGRRESSRGMKQFGPWLVCTFAFGLWSAALAPFSEIPTVNLALVMFCPVFGTFVFAMERLMPHRVS